MKTQSATNWKLNSFVFKDKSTNNTISFVLLT